MKLFLLIASGLYFSCVSFAQEIIHPEHFEKIPVALQTGSAYNKDVIRIVYSKPFALLKFLETTKGTHGTSVTLRQQMDSSAVLKQERFTEIKKSYNSLPLDYTWSRQAYPQKRKHTTSTWDLISVAAISSKNNKEFFERIIGILPNGDYLTLKRLVSETEPFYDAFMFTSQEKAIQSKATELRAYVPALNTLFDRFKVFYGSSWDKSVPFNLSIYPIYGRQGQTTATPHANSLEMGFLLESKDKHDMLAVGMHEMCHVLFEEQPLALQQRIDSAFTQQPDPYAAFAYRYIDEALATALGNGYAYQYLSTKMDTGAWYADNYIDHYAKALYPFVEEYLNAHKAMDKEFVAKAIGVFKQTFPNALYDIDALMMQSDAYFEDDHETVIDPLINRLHSDFRIYMSNTSIPIDDPGSLENIRSSEQTQVFIIYKNQAKNLKLLSGFFPNLKKLPKQANLLVSFLDEKNRPVILIIAENAAKAGEGISLLKKKGMIDPKQLWQSF